MEVASIKEPEMLDNPKENDQEPASEVPKEEEENPDKLRESGASSPDAKCAICLERHHNKSFTDSCFHQFCFTCLQEWSKVRPVCPLCKQPFKKIIHNVRSLSEYDQYLLKPVEVPPAPSTSGYRNFRYRTTMVNGRARRTRSQDSGLQRSSSRGSNVREFSMLHRTVSMQFRRQIYRNGMWVRPPQDTRFRETSAEFYRNNSACTHRLIPWVNRELCALLYEHDSQVAFALELIMSLITRFDILSPEFRQHVLPYLMDNTDHFIHEFYYFARSPHDMSDYDTQSSYQIRPLLVDELESSSDSDDDDVMVLMPSRSPSPEINVEDEGPNEADRPNPHSFRFSITPNAELARRSVALENIKVFLNRYNRVMPPFIRPDSPVAGPSGYSSSAGNSGSMAQPHDSSDSDPEGCVCVGYVKPVKERTPEVIDLSSDSDELLEVGEEPTPQNGDNEVASSPPRYATRSSTSSNRLSSVIAIPKRERSNSSHSWMFSTDSSDSESEHERKRKRRKRKKRSKRKHKHHRSTPEDKQRRKSKDSDSSSKKHKDKSSKRSSSKR